MLKHSVSAPWDVCGAEQTWSVVPDPQSSGVLPRDGGPDVLPSVLAGRLRVNACQEWSCAPMTSDMEAVGAANTTQAGLRLLATPDDGPSHLDYRDYAPLPALPTGFEGVSFPEDPIRLLSVQVQPHTHLTRCSGSA